MSNTAPTQTNLSTTLSNFEGAQAPANGASTAGYALTNSVFTTGYSDSDGNPNGIAITSVDNTKGLLWYSLDSGANWTPVSGVSANHALLLSGATTRLYYQAKQTADGNLNYNGLNTGVLTYRAWDQTSGSNGGYGDTTVNGGASAFSAVER
ncbi:MAG TPA: hypothetical protein DF614_03160, partial [Methylococcaceae bacterium]|nr:hypothetical protein [Methylococcaceae bacterium]